MMGTLRLGLLFGLVTTAACDLGGVSGPGGSGGPDADLGRDRPLGIVCNATMKTQGTFTISTPQPADYTGCWPIGTWSFTATLDTNECATPPAMLPKYEFKVEEVVDADGNSQQTYTYLTDPAAHHRLKVSQGGSGLCEGGLEIYSNDGKQYWNLKPELNADQSMTGFGEYALYSTDQWN
jgi:hypothetical protein